MAKLYNLARMSTATTGTGTITLGSAVSGYLTFALAGIADGDVISYAIKDGSASEIGTGTYTAAGTTLTRTVTKSTNSNTAISLTGSGTEVFITPRAEDLLSPPPIPGGRLTLTSGTPVTTTDVTAATVVYYAPIISPLVPIYNGSQTQNYQFTSSATDAVGLSVTLGANWATNTLYDWFVINDSGTIRLASGPAWTSDTARGTGAGTTELQLYDGQWTNKVSMTARYANASTTTTAANQGKYVGTFRTVAAGQAEDSLAKRFLYNAYNQAPRVLQNALETTDTWNYTTAAFRQANANTANQLDIVVGLAGSGIVIDCLGISANTGGNIFTSVGIGVDSTTVTSSQLMGPSTTTLTGRILTFAKYMGYPAIGRHYYPWLEYSTASGTTSWYGDNGNPTLSQSGLLGSILM